MFVYNNVSQFSGRKRCYGWRVAVPFFANVIFIRTLRHFGDSFFWRPSRAVGSKFSGLLSLQPHPCQSQLVFHVAIDHVHRWRQPGPDVSVKDQIPKPCFKAPRGNSSCHVRTGTQPKSRVFGAGNFGCAARFSPRLKTVLILLLMLPPIFG